MRHFFIALCLAASLAAPAATLNDAGRPADYVQTILARAQKAVDALTLDNESAKDEVRTVVANHYFALNDIYAERDSLKAAHAAGVQETCDARLYRHHFAFIAELALVLTAEQIDTVKDVLTYNVVSVTYTAQCDMIPTLKPEEKTQILVWLREAREYAIDAESSKAKHGVFGRYKGRINNYLTRRGYNLTKEREEWAKRVKARGGTL